jgi:hypothetical protein
MVVWIPYGGERSTDDRRTYIATAGPTGCCA